MAMLTGLVIAWAIAVPILTSMQPAAAGVTLAAHTLTIWRRRCVSSAPARSPSPRSTRWQRWRSRSSAARGTLAASRTKGSADIETGPLARVDTRAHAACLLVAGGSPSRSRGRRARARRCSSQLIAVRSSAGGFLIAGFCGSWRASSAPRQSISASAFLSIRAVRIGTHLAVSRPGTRPALVAFALFVTAIVFACATISNDNLQDLKTGQLVGPHPASADALIVGVVAGASVIPWCSSARQGYGFTGARTSGDRANPLPAPQATLISASHRADRRNLDWNISASAALVGSGSFCSTRRWAR